MYWLGSSMLMLFFQAGTQMEEIVPGALPQVGHAVTIDDSAEGPY